MPLYDYECPRCGDVKEALAKVDEVRKYFFCKCFFSNSQVSHKRVFNPTSTFVLKGEGWAKDNYSKPKKKKEGKE